MEDDLHFVLFAWPVDVAVMVANVPGNPVVGILTQKITSATFPKNLNIVKLGYNEQLGTGQIFSL